MASNSPRNRAKEQKNDVPNVEGLSVYERTLYFLRTDSIKSGSTAKSFLLKNKNIKRTKKNDADEKQSKRNCLNDRDNVDHDYHSVSNAVDLCNLSEESENSRSFSVDVNLFIFLFLINFAKLYFLSIRLITST